MSMGLKFLLCLILGLSTGARGQSVEAASKYRATVGREIEARVLFPAGQTFQYDTVFPLVVEYQNVSNSKQEFILSWSIPQELPKELQSMVLEPGAKKRIPLLFPPRTVSRLYSLEVNGHNISPGLGGAQGESVTGVLASGADTFDYLRSLQLVKNPHYNPTNNGDDKEYNTPQSVSTLDSTLLPEHWAALASLQTIICYDLGSLGLSKAQYQALEDWVRKGGVLVVVSNGIPEEYGNTPLAGILPLEATSVSGSGKMLRVDGKMSAQARVDYKDEQDSLLVSSSLNQGRVYFLTSPLLSPDLIGKEQTVALWRKIFNLPTDITNSRVISYSMLNNLPELPRAQAGWVALFVLLYGLIVGPLNLSLLRKKDKMLWSFATVPLVAILFAGSAYLINKLIRPSIPISRELGWLHLQEKEKVGIAESEQVLFSPHASTFTITSDAHTLFDVYQDHYGSFKGPRQLQMYRVTPAGGLESTIEMGTWDIQRFHNQSVMTLDSAFSLQWESEQKQVRIDSPLESDGEAAIIEHPQLGVSQAFHLKEGNNVYDLSFSKALSASNAMYFDEETHPGRSQLLNNMFNNQKLDSDKAKLFFWSSELKTPLQIDQGTSYKHDYLVGVEFEK